MKTVYFRGSLRNAEELSLRLGTAPDACEILPALYNRMGDDISSRLEGQYAFVLRSENTYFCSCDAFGTFPLYYYITAGGRFLVSPRPREIMRDAEFVRALDRDGLCAFLCFGYFPGERTIYRGLRKLLPGCSLTFSGGNCRVSRWFFPRFMPNDGLSEETAARRILDSMTEISAPYLETECGLFLSGGVDSSLTAALIRPGTAFTCACRDYEKSEHTPAAETANRLGVEHRICDITEDGYIDTLKSYIRASDLPLGDISGPALLMGCRSAVRECRSVCSGEGIDEFFGGYNSYRDLRPTEETPYLGNSMAFTGKDLNEILKEPYEYEAYAEVAPFCELAGNADTLSQMMSIDISTYLHADIIQNIRYCEAASGLDILTPFLDRRLFEVAAALPPHMRVADGVTKVAFRRAAEKLLPPETAYRAKMGFPLPIRQWLEHGRLRELIFNVFESKTADDFFRKDALASLLTAYAADDTNAHRKIWHPFVFLLWSILNSDRKL